MKTLLTAAIILISLAFISDGVFAADRSGRGEGKRNERLKNIPAKAPSNKPKPTHENVVYGNKSGQDLKLDVYLAESGTPAPVVIFIHGGGWQAGNKSQVPEFLLKEAKALGISVVSVAYRFTDVAPHPAQVFDCARAIQFVRRNAKEWNIDPKKVCLMGISAGAHISLWIGLHDEMADPKSDDPVERESTRVTCIAEICGPAKFRMMKDMKKEDGAIARLLGVEPGTTPDQIPQEAIDAISPHTYISSDDPPVLICHGAIDTLVDPEHAEVLDKTLKEAGVESKYVLVEGAGHNVAKFPETEKAVLDFVKKHLLGED